MMSSIPSSRREEKTKMKIRITAGEVESEAELNDSMTAKLIWDALPIEARGNRWGEEIYFRTPVRTDLEARAHGMCFRRESLATGRREMPSASSSALRLPAAAMRFGPPARST